MREQCWVSEELWVSGEWLVRAQYCVADLGVVVMLAELGEDNTDVPKVHLTKQFLMNN